MDDFDLSIKLDNLKRRKVKETCCHSYQTPKGRCYSCPDRQLEN